MWAIIIGLGGVIILLTRNLQLITVKKANYIRNIDGEVHPLLLKHHRERDKKTRSIKSKSQL